MEKPDPHGPENIPLREFIKSYKVAVFVINLKKNDEIIDMREIDYSNREDKGWLGRITMWALNQGYSIEIMRLQDAEGRG